MPRDSWSVFSRLNCGKTSDLGCGSADAEKTTGRRVRYPASGRVRPVGNKAGAMPHVHTRALTAPFAPTAYSCRTWELMPVVCTAWRSAHVSPAGAESRQLLGQPAPLSRSPPRPGRPAAQRHLAAPRGTAPPAAPSQGTGLGGCSPRAPAAPFHRKSQGKTSYREAGRGVIFGTKRFTFVIRSNFSLW